MMASTLPCGRRAYLPRQVPRGLQRDLLKRARQSGWGAKRMRIILFLGYTTLAIGYLLAVWSLMA